MSVAFNAIRSAKTGVGEFFALINSFGDGPLGSACGLETASAAVADIGALAALASVIGEHLGSATKAVFSVAELLLCRSFTPLYTSLTYDIVGTDLIDMISPMLWSMFIISICSMIMVTLRVAWHEFVPEIVQDEVLADSSEDDVENKDGDLEMEEADVVQDSETQ